MDPKTIKILLVIWLIVFALIAITVWYAVWLEAKEKLQEEKRRDARFAKLRNERKQ